MDTNSSADLGRDPGQTGIGQGTDKWKVWHTIAWTSISVICFAGMGQDLQVTKDTEG